MADKKMTAADIHKLIKEKEVKYVDIRFTDPRGKWQHVTFDLMMVDDDFLNEGTMFDGSSIAGWKAINESDMLLKPDLDTAVIDPFFAQTTLILICDVLEPLTGQHYARCPRSIAKAAEAFVNSSGVGDTTYFGPEAEFFIFDDVRFDVGMNKGFYYVDSKEGAYNSGTEYPEGNLGHRPKVKGGYFPVPPVDSEQDMRGEMLAVMRDMGIKPEKHHHEVATAQHELGFKFNTLTKCGDYMQIYKYVIHQVAQAYGKTATFMPKPIYGDNGSGMHVHQSIWKGGKPLFAGSGYADLSDICLYYIGGIIKHAKALNAFTNPLTNSYKRLIPGFEAPVLLAYSARNRSASCRIPLLALAQRQARRGSLPRSGREPLSRLCRHADGGPGRDREQDPSGRPDGQGPLCLAAGRTGQGAAGLRLLARSAGQSQGRPRLPQEGRCVQPGLHRKLYRAQDGRSVCLRAYAASD